MSSGIKAGEHGMVKEMEKIGNFYRIDIDEVAHMKKSKRKSLIGA